MKIKINKDTYDTLINADWKGLLEKCWQGCSNHWLLGQKKIASIYIDKRLAEEELINAFIIKHTYHLSPYQPNDSLPLPDRNQEKLLDFRMMHLEKRTPCYNFFDHSTHRPTRARWLYSRLEKWYLDLNHPLHPKLNGYRDINGVKQKGEFRDPLLDVYEKNGFKVDPVLKYCRNFSDAEILAANLNIGKQRGPLGEFATEALGILKDGKSSLHNTYATLFERVSEFYSSFNALKSVSDLFFEKFAKAVSTDPTAKSFYYVDVEQMSNYIVQYCRAMKAVMTKAISLKYYLPEFLKASSKRGDLESDVNDLIKDLINGILLLNQNLSLFIEAKLAEIEPDDYEPSEDCQPDVVPKIDPPLTHAVLVSLLSEKIEDNVSSSDSQSSSPRPAEPTMSPKPRRRKSSGRKDRPSAHEPLSPSARSLSPGRAAKLAGSAEQDKSGRKGRPPAHEPLSPSARSLSPGRAAKLAASAEQDKSGRKDRPSAHEPLSPSARSLSPGRAAKLAGSANRDKSGPQKQVNTSGEQSLSPKPDDDTTSSKKLTKEKSGRKGRLSAHQPLSPRSRSLSPRQAAKLAASAERNKSGPQKQVNTSGEQSLSPKPEDDTPSSRPTREKGSRRGRSSTDRQPPLVDSPVRMKLDALGSGAPPNQQASRRREDSNRSTARSVISSTMPVNLLHEELRRQREKELYSTGSASNSPIVSRPQSSTRESIQIHTGRNKERSDNATQGLEKALSASRVSNTKNSSGKKGTKRTSRSSKQSLRRATELDKSSPILSGRSEGPGRDNNTKVPKVKMPLLRSVSSSGRLSSPRTESHEGQVMSTADNNYCLS